MLHPSHHCNASCSHCFVEPSRSAACQKALYNCCRVRRHRCRRPWTCTTCWESPALIYANPWPSRHSCWRLNIWTLKWATQCCNCCRYFLSRVCSCCMPAFAATCLPVTQLAFEAGQHVLCEHHWPPSITDNAQDMTCAQHGSLK